MKHAAALFLMVVLAGGLSGCGEAPPDLDRVYPLRRAYVDMMARPYDRDIEISGVCSGSGISRGSEPEPSSFDGVDGYVVNYLSSMTFGGDCDSTPVSDRVKTIFDKNYNPIVSYSPDATFAKFSIADVGFELIPEYAKIGNKGELGNMRNYNNESMETYVGYTSGSYSMVLGEDRRVYFELHIHDYNAFDQLLYYLVDRYHVGEDNKLTYANSSFYLDGNPELEFIFTPKKSTE